jgi:amidase
MTAASALPLSDCQSWEEKVSWARTKRDASLAKVEPKLQGLPENLPNNSRDLPKLVLTQREIEITENYTAIELLAVLRERKISVEEVTRAFLRRAVVAHAAVSLDPC